MAVTKVVPLWFGARGVEFQWANLQGALDSNINLVSLTLQCGLVLCTVHTYIQIAYTLAS